MYDHNQIEVPDSFVALFIDPGRQRPNASRAEVSARYEFCEDLANHLFEYARAQHHDLGIDEGEVLARVLLGLQQPDSSVSPAEARWVVRRLAELESWPDPEVARLNTGS
jgi:hypothetical protein